MITMNLEEQKEKLEFVQRAAKLFANSKRVTFTDGSLFALRFGLDNDCVVVFRIDEDFPVENYQNIIN